MKTFCDDDIFLVIRFHIFHVHSVFYPFRKQCLSRGDCIDGISQIKQCIINFSNYISALDFVRCFFCKFCIK